MFKKKKEEPIVKSFEFPEVVYVTEDYDYQMLRLGSSEKILRVHKSARDALSGHGPTKVAVYKLQGFANIECDIKETPAAPPAFIEYEQK